MESRKKIIDDTDKIVLREELSQINPWLPSFTPSAATKTAAPPKRPLSPMSGSLLRATDLMPLTLERERSDQAESSNFSDDSRVRFICPVSRNTITNQKVIYIKSTNQLMLESVFNSLALPSMLCPVTSKPFRPKDILEVARASSGYAASGKVEAVKYRPNFN